MNVFISQKQLASLLGTTTGTLNTWRYTGKLKGIPFIKLGTRYKYPIEEVQTWINNQIQTDKGDYYGNAK